MIYLVERLAALRRYLDRLRKLRPRVPAREALERDFSLHNDVLISLLTVCRLVIDIAGELSARRGERFEDYMQAVCNLATDERFSADLVRELERLPGFRIPWRSSRASVSGVRAQALQSEIPRPGPGVSRPDARRRAMS
jgi:hypothetical protein